MKVSISLRLSVFVILLSTLFYNISAQDFSKGGINTVNSAVPFLRIIPDARGGGLGDVGIATSPERIGHH